MQSNFKTKVIYLQVSIHLSLNLLIGVITINVAIKKNASRMFNMEDK